MTNNNLKLKPYPFCGKRMNLTYNSLIREYHIWHNSFQDEICYLVEPFRIPVEYAGSLREASEAWNRRSTHEGIEPQKTDPG